MKAIVYDNNGIDIEVTLESLAKYLMEKAYWGKIEIEIEENEIDFWMKDGKALDNIARIEGDHYNE